MKIAWLVNNINQVGGIEQVVCGLSTYFSDTLSYNVQIISINTFETNIYFPLSKAVTVRHCGLDWQKQTRSSLHSTIRRELSQLDADILITCHTYITIGVLLNRNKFRGKIIATRHGPYNVESKKRFLLGALMYRFANAFVVLTESDRQVYKKWLCKPITIPNAIFSCISDRSDLSGNTLLASGRLTKIKGFDHLIQAFSMVAEKHPKWKLCICGDGEEKAALVQQVANLNLAERVLFPGFVDLSKYMPKADAFALSSHNEGFPLVLLEAMAHGLPVVSYALPAAKEICGNECALLAEPDNITALAQRLDELLSSKEVRCTLGQKAFQISKKYSVLAIGQRWVDLFNSLTGR